MNRLKYIKPYGPEKCPVLLILPYVGVKSNQIARDIKNMTEIVYHASNQRVIFTSTVVLNPKCILQTRVAWSTYMNAVAQTFALNKPSGIWKPE